jgi:uncharacterized protein YbaR (Trm112 family)
MKLSKELLEILACPRCKGRLEDDGGSLLCVACGLKYPVRDGIPVLLAEEAEKIAE